jgi:hypothetical protein
MVAPIYWRRRVLAANTVGPYCLCDFSHLEKAKRIEKVIFVETSSVNKAGTSGKGNRFFTQKLHVQMTNSTNSNQSPVPDY